MSCFWFVTAHTICVCPWQHPGIVCPGILGSPRAEILTHNISPLPARTGSSGCLRSLVIWVLHTWKIRVLLVCMHLPLELRLCAGEDFIFMSLHMCTDLQNTQSRSSPFLCVCNFGFWNLVGISVKCCSWHMVTQLSKGQLCPHLESASQVLISVAATCSAS